MRLLAVASVDRLQKPRQAGQQVLSVEVLNALGLLGISEMGLKELQMLFCSSEEG